MGELAASQEDVDLLIAWEDLRGRHLVLIEAKGLFTEELRHQFDVHLFLAGPSPAKGLNVDDWPDWTQPGAHTLSLYQRSRYALRRTTL
jgi:hypothetical protein